MALKMSFREMFGIDEDYVDDADSLSFEFIMSFGNRILNQIDNLGMNQKELAERAGMSASSLSKVLSGDSNPTVRTLERIAMAAGLEMTHIVLNALGTNAIRYNKPGHAKEANISYNGEAIGIKSGYKCMDEHALVSKGYPTSSKDSFLKGEAA